MWQLWNPAAAGWIKSWFSCSLAEELFLACQDKQFFSVSAVILNTLDPFHIFFDCGKMTPKYKSELESAKKLAEMVNKVTYCFIASCQRCSHRLGVVKICGAIFKNLCVPFFSTPTSCGAFVQMTYLSAMKKFIWITASHKV